MKSLSTHSLITIILIFCLHIVAAQGYGDYSIDHIPIVVNNLEEAQKTFKELGFVIKPGRKHTNSIENAHIKFQDGSALELITATEPKDGLAKLYIKQKDIGDGPVFLAIQMQDPDLTETLLSDFNPKITDGSYYKSLTFDEDQPLSYLFFITYTDEVVDKKEHLSHNNGVLGLKSITLSKPDFNSEEMLFAYLGMEVVDAKKVKIGNHEILLDKSTNAHDHRVIKSVTLLVKDIHETMETLPKAIPFEITRDNRIILKANNCHGIEIVFEQKR